jgi:hypothetical protein
LSVPIQLLKNGHILLSDLICLGVQLGSSLIISLYSLHRALRTL